MTSFIDIHSAPLCTDPHQIQRYLTLKKWLKIALSSCSSAETPSVTRRASLTLSDRFSQGSLLHVWQWQTSSMKQVRQTTKEKNDKALAPHCPDHSPVMDKSAKLDTGRHFLHHSNGLEVLSLSPGVCHLSHVSEVCSSIEVTIIPISCLQMVDWHVTGLVMKYWIRC